MQKVTDNPNRTLTLTGAQCRKVASFCCDRSHRAKPEDAAWLKLCASTFLTASDGIRDAATCEVPGKLSSFLRLWNWLFGSNVPELSEVGAEISAQMSREAE